MTPFQYGQYHGVASLRKMLPYPYVLINTEKAEESGIQEKDWVTMGTPSGSIRLQAKLKEWLKPRIVCTQHGW